MGAPKGLDLIEKASDLATALIDCPPLVEAHGLNQSISLIVELIQLAEESFHVQRGLWAAEWRTDPPPVP